MPPRLSIPSATMSLGSYHILPTPAQQPPNSFLAPLDDFTDLTMVLKGLQLLLVQAWEPLPHPVPASLSDFLSPTSSLKIIQKKFSVVFHMQQTISCFDAFVELCPLCLPMLSFPRLILILQASAGSSPSRLSYQWPKPGLGSRPGYTWVPPANPLIIIILSSPHLNP